MKKIMPKIRPWALLAIVGLLTTPLTTSAITSTSYEIIDGGTSGYGQHTAISTNYELVGSLDPMVAYSTSTSYLLDSGSTLHAEYCGDGEINGSESCDGSELGGETCVTQGFDSGTLSCSSSCAFTTSNCSNDDDGGGGGGGGGGRATTAPSAPTVNTYSDSVFTSTITLTGGRGTNVSVYMDVNGAASDVTYPTSTTWKAEISLAVGENTIEIYVKNSKGSSSIVTATVTRLAGGYGDATGDGVVDDYDLSLLAFYWGTSNSLTDFNEDGIVDDYDLSIMVAYWFA